MELTDRIVNNIGHIIIGKEQQIRLVLAAALAGGHVLLEDVPGTGKTVLAKALARSFDCTFGRIQFTPDLLPSELTGINFYNPKTGEFSFRKGSLFANIILADEINRATPRTQAGLLESMEESQITVDGETIRLDKPYFVIATQNPIETHGTFPLPEAQLDRFLIRLNLGYPQKSEVSGILKDLTEGRRTETPEVVCTKEELLEMQAAVNNIFVHKDLCTYMADLCDKTRNHDSIALGVSTRGLIGLLRMSQAYAYMKGREYVVPEDIKYLTPYVFSHRIMLRGRAAHAGSLMEDIINDIPVPTENWEKRL